MKRTTLSLVVVVAVLALVVGFATMTKPSAGHATEAKPRQVPIQRTDAVCPQVRANPGASTLYTAYTPASASAGAGAGEATLTELADRTKVRGKADAVGRPVSLPVDTAENPPLGWTASGSFAAGFAAQSTTRLATGTGRGLSGTVCETPGTDEWFVGTSTAPNRESYLYLANSTNVGAQVDVELYGPDGAIQIDGVRSMTFAPGEAQNIRLDTLKAGLPVATVHVIARTGRIAAAVRDTQGATGSDWLPQAGQPGRSFVVPGLPADASSVKLTVFGASDTDTEVGVEIIGKASTFKPAGFESVTVKRGEVKELDLGPITQGEAGALKLTAARADVLVGVRVVRGSGDNTDAAFLAGTPALGGRGVVADNRAGGAFTDTVFLTAPQGAAKVRLIAAAGGDPATADVDVPAGTTVAVPAPVPAGAGQFALSIEPQPGSGPVHAARMINEQADKVPMFTIQGSSPARETVDLPTVRGDLTIMVQEPKSTPSATATPTTPGAPAK
ncbi:DUF5719 family protein [Uniformispora flossi]|uniref:DUF5719 family protein n=1 Tax=Uniformispora flossi TaxID=3390723 RepID=UPI003C2B966F